MSIPKISIALPIYSGMKNAEFFLTRCLNSILEQSYDDFEVVITDNSDDDRLEKICHTYGMNIRHFYNPRKGISANTNEAIKRSRGDLIKILNIDDYFAHEWALDDILEAFRGHWLISAVSNNRYPRYTTNIHVGNNKLGGPPALTILNKNPFFFDENLTWMLDCDYYRRMFDSYGEPIILSKVNVNIGEHKGQMTNTIQDEVKQKEVEMMIKKYGRI